MTKFSEYLQAIARVNHLGHHLKTQWLFYCGMLFLSQKKWWGDFKYRPARHEGIDICWHRMDQDDTVHGFTPETRIPAMENGTVLNICDDFLGKTLVVEQKNPTASDFKIVFTYAHIVPEPGISIGHQIKKDQVIASVCDTHKNPQLEPHLHFSCFEIIEPVLETHLDWDVFTDPEKVNMICPVFL